MRLYAQILISLLHIASKHQKVLNAITTYYVMTSSAFGFETIEVIQGPNFSRSILISLLHTASKPKAFNVTDYKQEISLKRIIDED